MDLYNREKAVAICDFEPDESFTNALTFKEGDVFFVMDKTNEEWYYAELDGKEGYVPANYLEFTK